MDNINTEGPDWMVNEKEKDSHQFNEEKESPKEKKQSPAQNLQTITETPKHITCVKERDFESPL